MERKLKIKVITGFRRDQFYSIDADEAHKAYYLFLNPEQRGVFNNGVALIGQDIRGIEPDYNATMGWHADHVLDGDDWRELRRSGMDERLRDTITLASIVAKQHPDKISLPLSEIKLLE